MKITKGQPYPLGISTNGEEINFAVAVPEGKCAKLLLYTEIEEKPVKEVNLEPAMGEVCCISISELEREVCYYNFYIDGEVFLDPYVRALAGKYSWGEKKDIKKLEICGKIYPDEYDWENDRNPRIAYEDVIAYSLHVRGFTKDKDSGVNAKGTFEGVVEKLSYLKELGINQVQCMPVYEFEECKEPVNYWGYGDAYYFAPKNAYSHTGDGRKSLKDMVKALHKAGIEVVLEMPFSEKTPKYLAADCLKYYVEEYHVDGFICNQMTAAMDVLKSDPYLKGTKIMEHQTGYKDTMRRFLKGDEGQIYPVIYWLKHISEQSGIFNYITSHSGFTMNDLVSYNEKHNVRNQENNRDGADENNSWNCGKEGPTQYDDIVALRKNQVRNAFVLMMLSQGTPCILAGDEWGNTQLGNNNVYCQDNELGWLNWERFPYHHDLFEFVRDLIALRKMYKVFHPTEEFKEKDLKNCGIPDVSYHGEEAWRADLSWDSRRIGVYYHREEDVYIAYNMHWEEGRFALPKLPEHKKWYQKASTKEGVYKTEILLEEQQGQMVNGRSIAVYVGK